MSVIAGAGLAPTRSVLDSGLVVLAKQTTATPAVTIHAMSCAGSVHDPADLPGVAHFVARVMDRGTETLSADEIADQLDERGVSLAIRPNRHTTAITVDCLREDVDAMLALVADVIRRPAFPEDQIALRRREILTGLGQDEDNPAARATTELFPLLYGPAHAYSRRPKGTPGSVERITGDDLVAFHQARFAPHRLSIAVVGDIEPARAVDEAARAFEDWRAAGAEDDPIPAPVPRTRREMRVVPMPSKAQADIAYGFVTITRTDPAYYAYLVMNTVLGQYGIGGRIGDALRERQGLAYYAYSAFDPHVVAGPLMVRAGVDGASVDRAVATIDAQVAAMAADGPTDDELADTKRFLIGSLPRTLETNAGIAFFLQTAEHFGLGLDHDLRLPALIEAVSRDAAHAAARQLSPDRAAIVVAGPYEGAPA
ncbi:MAG TPA: pitrilysin family protein [Vicinamibacterales bacterium]|nr:pitrilysin family protein [Vicinamibacterales bacterium]